MFLAAMLQSPEGSVPVKVRDMSVSGAMLDAPELPIAGSPVRLVRGSLVAPGDVVWRAKTRCGLMFSSPVCVKDWLAAPMNQGQERVDHVMRSIRAGAVPFEPRQQTVPPGAAARGGPDHRRLALDLTLVIGLLEDLGEHLAADPATIEMHGAKLQNLDIGLQTLTAIAESLSLGAEKSLALPARLQQLRTSCGEVLRPGSIL